MMHEPLVLIKQTGIIFVEGTVYDQPFLVLFLEVPVLWTEQKRVAMFSGLFFFCVVELCGKDCFYFMLHWTSGPESQKLRWS